VILALVIVASANKNGKHDKCDGNSGRRYHWQRIKLVAITKYVKMRWIGNLCGSFCGKLPFSPKKCW
jgi:hypothetical protein